MSPATSDRASVRVLVVEDAPEFLAVIVSLLRQEGFGVEQATDGEAAVEVARTIEPEVVVLDLNLPKLDGIEVCRRIRTFSDAYVIMLTAKDDEVDKLIGLSVGADDYMTKPFSPRELLARIRAMLRRPRTGAHDDERVRRIGELRIDPLAREVFRGDEQIELTRIEFDLLDVLSSNPRMAFSREKLLEKVWGPDWFGDDHVVDVHVSNLRKKIGDDPSSPALHPDRPWRRLPDERGIVGSSLGHGVARLVPHPAERAAHRLRLLLDVFDQCRRRAGSTGPTPRPRARGTARRARGSQRRARRLQRVGEALQELGVPLGSCPGASRPAGRPARGDRSRRTAPRTRWRPPRAGSGRTPRGRSRRTPGRVRRGRGCPVGVRARAPRAGPRAIPRPGAISRTRAPGRRAGPACRGSRPCRRSGRLPGRRPGRRRSSRR